MTVIQPTIATCACVPVEKFVDHCIKALGANAIVGVDIDYETIDRGQGGSSMLMVSASGTAVRVAG